jgi:hypothetical protein
MRPDSAIVFWESPTLPLFGGLTLIHCGGHFAGSSVLHWRDGADGKGLLFTGDTIQVVADARYVTFQYSYPNVIPLNAAKVQRIVDAVSPFPFERLYNAFRGCVKSDAKAAVKRSAERYIRAISPA